MVAGHALYFFARLVEHGVVRRGFFLEVFELDLHFLKHRVVSPCFCEMFCYIATLCCAWSRLSRFSGKALIGVKLVMFVLRRFIFHIV